MSGIFPGGTSGPRKARGRLLVGSCGRSWASTLPDAASPKILEEDDVEFHLWVVGEWDGEVRNGAEEEHDDIGWFTRSEVERLPLASERYFDLLFGE